MAYIPYNADSFKVVFYGTGSTGSPAMDFFHSLDSKFQAKVILAVKLLAEYGTLLREPYSKALENGIFELRTQSEGKAIRLLYFHAGDRRIVITHGFLRKPGKLPAAKSSGPFNTGNSFWRSNHEYQGR